jgi:hypothetical protein
MTETDVECILQRAREAWPEERPRIISDNGPQFVAKDFKEFRAVRNSERCTAFTDSRYVTVTPEDQFEVSRRIKGEFENGRDDYPCTARASGFPRTPLTVLPLSR